jgi:hypothetical protein
MRMRIPVLALALAAAPAPTVPVWANDDDPKPPQPPASSQPILQMPELPAPVVTRRTVRGRMAPDMRPPGTPAGELGGLRAVALREGSADVSLDGVARKIEVGDALGSGTVLAIGANRIVLERPFSVPGGVPSRATVILTFGKGGVPRERTIVEVRALPPPTPFEEAR